VYSYLGSEVGKNLFIEQTTGDNYTLIYRRRGNRSSTHRVAQKHAKLLKHKGISTTIIVEKNNPVVFGESSHLNDDTSFEIITIAAKKKPAAAKDIIPPGLAYQNNADPPMDIKAASDAGRKEVEQAIETFIKELNKLYPLPAGSLG
jgi:hypothetical protein